MQLAGLCHLLLSVSFAFAFLSANAAALATAIERHDAWSAAAAAAAPAGQATVYSATTAQLARIKTDDSPDKAAYAARHLERPGTLSDDPHSGGLRDEAGRHLDGGGTAEEAITHGRHCGPDTCHACPTKHNCVRHKKFCTWHAIDHHKGLHASSGICAQNKEDDHGEL